MIDKTRHATDHRLTTETHDQAAKRWSMKCQVHVFLIVSIVTYVMSGRLVDRMAVTCNIAGLATRLFAFLSAVDHDRMGRRKRRGRLTDKVRSQNGVSSSTDKVSYEMESVSGLIRFRAITYQSAIVGGGSFDFSWPCNACGSNSVSRVRISLAPPNREGRENLRAIKPPVWRQFSFALRTPDRHDQVIILR